MDVQKKAEELAEAIMNSPEYQRMVSARAKVNQHQAARVMLRDFQKKQLELQQKQMEGQDITPQEEEQLQNLFGVISINPYIRELFEAEFAFSGLMLQVNDALARVLDFPEEEEGSEGPKLEVPKKRILIPGQDL
ncbi:MAG TPA: YlbF family regulator [Firmicutes bacterium]|nr:YlbF family regulator [Bacillota bacterium]